MELKPARLHLNMILKEDEPVEMVRRSIESVRKHVDDVYITLTYKDKKPTEKNEILKYLKAEKFHVSFFKWVKDFSAARNFAMDQCPHGPTEFIYWQDADDVLQGAENLPKLLEDAVKFNIAAFFFHYWYMVDLDEKGNVHEILVDHKRERIIRNDHTFKWIGKLHETLIEQRQENIQKNGVETDTCVVVHLTEDARIDKNIDRNIEILENQAAEELHKDPRTLIYLARAYYDKGKMSPDPAQRKIYFDLALTLFHEYLEGSGDPGEAGYREGSGWAEERSTAWSHVGEIAILSKAYDIAIQAYHSAIEEAPQFPNLYIDLAMVYSMKGDFPKAKHWLNLASSMDVPKTTIITLPRDMKTRALEIDFQISLREGSFTHCLEDLKLLKDIMPHEKSLDERIEQIKVLDAENKASQSIVFLGKFLESKEEKAEIKKAKLASLVESIPTNLQMESFASEMRHLFLPAKIWEKDEIAILCGPGFEEWSPSSIKTGLGGSEQAVVYLGKELQKLGWKVTVFANPGKAAGDFEGVKYLPWYMLNPKDNFNVLVLWRNIGFVDFKPKAKFTMVWMHDVPNNPDFTEDRVDKVNKIAVLSEFHKGLLRLDRGGKFEPMPNEKVFLTGNGIVPMKPSKKVKRDPHRLIYSSSPDRGLVFLLKMWPDIIKEVPDANLHIFYGFNIFDAIHKGAPGRMKWKQMVVDLMKQPGITYHGRVGHNELHKEQAQAGIWAYPTDFDEISCITGMECQALGAVPVTTTVGAVNETVKNGVKVDVDIRTEEGQKEYKEQLIKLLKNPKKQKEYRDNMMKWAQEHFLWSNVAKQWDQELRIRLQNPDLLAKTLQSVKKGAIK